MGWSFRRSINLGPLRINASKSGLGYSVGGRGFRFGRDAKGRKYTAASIPGTGIYNRTYLKTPAATHTPTTNIQPPPPVSIPGHGSKRSIPALGQIVLYGLSAAGIYLVVSAI